LVRAQGPSGFTLKEDRQGKKGKKGRKKKEKAESVRPSAAIITRTSALKWRWIGAEQKRKEQKREGGVTSIHIPTSTPTISRFSPSVTGGRGWRKKREKKKRERVGGGGLKLDTPE